MHSDLFMLTKESLIILVKLTHSREKQKVYYIFNKFNFSKIDYSLIVI